MASIVAEYLFDTGSGTTLFDTSGNGLNGTFGGGSTAPTWVAGGGILFDGVDDIITVPANNLFNLPNAQSIEMIFSWTSGNSGVIDHTGAGATNKNWQYMIEAGNFRYRVMKSASQFTDTFATGPVSGTIYHVICTYDGTTMRQYINNSVPHTTGVVAPLDVVNGDIYIGHLGTGVYPFKGTIYKIVVYDYALSASDVAHLNTVSATGLRTEVEYTDGIVVDSGLRTEVEYTDGLVLDSGLRTVVDYTNGTVINTALRTIYEYDLSNVTPPPPDTGLEPPPIPFCPTNIGQGPPVPRDCIVNVPGGGTTPSQPLTYGVPFRLYRKDCEIRLKQWGAIDAYNIVKPFGGESFERGAEI